MAKKKEEKKIAEAQIEPRYRMIPVDLQTYEDLIQLCVLRGFGRRGNQGLMVKNLVKAELAKDSEQAKTVAV